MSDNENKKSNEKVEKSLSQKKLKTVITKK